MIDWWMLIPVEGKQENMVNWDKGEKLQQEVDSHPNLILNGNYDHDIMINWHDQHDNDKWRMVKHEVKWEI